MGTRRLPGMPHAHSLHLMFCPIQHPTLLDSATRTELPKDRYVHSAGAAFQASVPCSIFGCKAHGLSAVFQSQIGSLVSFLCSLGQHLQLQALNKQRKSPCSNSNCRLVCERSHGRQAAWQQHRIRDATSLQLHTGTCHADKESKEE